MKKSLLLLTVVTFVVGEFVGHNVELHKTCEDHEIACGNGTCLPAVVKCDGTKDCPGGEDEDFCESKFDWKCDSHLWTCPDSGYCIPHDWLCNGETDCNDGSDEKNCTKILNGKCYLGQLEGFLCQNQECIRREFKCDKRFDCKDGSDEINCEGTYLQPKVAPEALSLLCSLDEGYFRCHDNMSCIPESGLCNNFPDCGDKSDEGPECWLANHTDACRNCKFGCIRTPSGAFCKCPSGYMHGEQSQCHDVDECREMPDSCSQKCENLEGSFKCSCVDDYVLMPDNKSCQVKFDYFDPLLVFVVDRQIRSFNIKTNATKVIVNASAIGVSYDKNHCYWTEVTQNEAKIMRIDTVGGKPEVIVDAGLSLPEDVTVDWLTGNIYITDNEMARIAVCNAKGDHCAILVDNMTSKPRAIVLDPHKGHMYWSDWGDSPAIMKANMDGSDVKTLVTENVTWPNGLALDYAAERLYWVDGHHGHIESVALDGSARHLVLQSSVHHPFWLGVFENTLFWSDWQLEQLLSCDKLNGKDRKVLDSGKIFGIDIYHPVLKKASTSHGCVGNKCSHLCLLKENGGYSCACPEDKALANDKHNCLDAVRLNNLMVGGGKLMLKLQLQQIGRQLSTPVLLSLSSIDLLAYNPIKDLVYIYDKVWNHVLAVQMNKFNQGLYQFIIGYNLGRVEGMVFDYIGNALYWTDSEHLTVEVMSMRTGHRAVVHTFTDGEIPKSLCIAPEYGKLFVAVKESSSIRVDALSLDGKERKRIFDEGFKGPTLSLHYSTEHDTLYIADSGNGYITTAHPEGTARQVIRKTGHDIGSFTVLGSEMYWISSESKYLHHANIHESDSAASKRLLLDVFTEGIPQLHMVSLTHTPKQGHTNLSHPCTDLLNPCSHICVQGGNATRRSYTCLCPNDMVMLEKGVCEDKVSCDYDQFHCYESNQCIDIGKKCDNYQNCLKGEDERGCHGDMFHCKNGREVLMSQVCNNANDCLDNSDEINCKTNQSHCGAGLFVCGNGECLDRRHVCDSHSDCDDDSDEDVVMCRNHACDERTEFRCSLGNCIPHQWECDGEADCGDGSDEHSKCKKQGPCGMEQFHCSFGGCIPLEHRCDGNNDCDDFSDEDGCLEPTEKTLTVECEEYACPTNRSICLPMSAVCNKTSECPGSADEMDCEQSECLSNEWQCHHGGQCILLQWVCDGKSDCHDGSDERRSYCGDKDPLWRQSLVHATNCKYGFSCDSGECIDYREVCDGEKNCHDGSDEGGMCNDACRAHKCGHDCRPTPRGPLCQCKHGYRLTNDSSGCQDVNECTQLINACSQTCHNTIGSFRCGCYEGFGLRHDGRTCKAEGKPAEILYLAKNEIKSLSVHGDMRRTVFKNTAIYPIHSMVANYGRNRVYFTSETERKLYIHDMTSNKTTHVTNVGNPTKVSVDWSTGNVYFVDNTPSDKKMIVCDMLQQRCASLQMIKNYHTVLALTIDPINSLMFYCTKRTEPNEFAVFRTELNGDNTIEIWSSETKACSSLALDIEKKTLFLAERNGGRVYMANYNGRTSVLSDTLNVKKPTDMAYFEDHLYVMNSDTSKLARCALYMDQLCTWISLQEYDSRGFVIYQEMVERPRKLNPCKDYACDGVCVNAPAGPQCLDEMHDQDGAMALFSEPLLKSTSRKVTSVIVGFVMCALSLLAVSPFLYHYWNAKSKKEHIPVHFQNPACGEFMATRFPEPTVTITPPTHGSTYTEFVNPLERYLQGAWRNVQHKWKQQNKKPQHYPSLSLEIPDQDSDAESDRDIDFKDRARLVR